MSRSGESITRVDIRFPNEIYDVVQQIAVNDGARIHHISQKVEVSPTIVRLVQLGIDALNGKLPDNADNIPDILSDIIMNSLPDKVTLVSGISDTRIEAIVDRRLAELGLFPDRQIESDSTPHLLPDNGGKIPDILSDKTTVAGTVDISDIIPDKKDTVTDKGLDPNELPDNAVDLSDKISDNKNIPSDDSSNSEHVSEDVQVQAIEKASGETPQSFSFAGFHNWIELDQPDKQNKANGDIAIAIAKEKGLGDWRMDSKTRKFTKTNSGDN